MPGSCLGPWGIGDDDVKTNESHDRGYFICYFLSQLIEIETEGGFDEGEEASCSRKQKKVTRVRYD